MNRVRWSVLLVVLAVAPVLRGGELPLLYRSDFSKRTLDDWAMTDRSAWGIVEDGGELVLALNKQSRYAPKVRSPVNYAILPAVPVTDFQLDVKLKSTARDYGHRDLCVFFGYQNPEHFYYVHVANAADPHAHSVFLVNGSARVSIAEERTKGVVWGNGWHHLRVVRDAKSGLIQVYFDDMVTPIMKATDKTLPMGAVGIGSFDDTGRFATLDLHGEKAVLREAIALPANRTDEKPGQP